MKTWHSILKKLLTLYVSMNYYSEFPNFDIVSVSSTWFSFSIFSLFLKTNQTERNMCKYLVITYSALKHDWKASSFSYYFILGMYISSSSKPSKKRRMDGWKAQRKKISFRLYVGEAARPTASSLYVFMDFY